MTRNSRRLTLAGFAAPYSLRGPRRALEGLGHTIDAVPRPQLTNPRLIQETDIIAIVCDPGHGTLNEMEAFLAQAAAMRTLGILHCDSGSWKPRTLRQFTEFVTWPCHPWELEARLNRLCPEASDRTPNDYATLTEQFVGLNLIGRSPEFLKVLGLIKNLSKYDVPVLIQGATGTGKELLARALHFLSSRRDHPFIPVNCGAIPDSLFENELYGHQKGAFTDAKEAQPGLVELAHTGTLFLDEVDALTPKAQVALLRFLEDQEYKPLGGRRLRRADIRLVAATNTDLLSAVAAGNFRSDLLYRLNVAHVHIPLLRLRPDDIELLADHFLAMYSGKYGLPVRVFSQELRESLTSHDWPGNVRELENFIQRALMLSDGPVVHLPDSESGSAAFTSVGKDQEEALFRADLTRAKTEMVYRFEDRYLRRLMARTKGNVTIAARLAGKERRSFGKMLKKHAIERETYSVGPHDFGND